MTKQTKRMRQNAVNVLKRDLILDAARRVFESEGLEGASLRAIAAEAGYTPAALYFHFDSKEAIYAEVLRDSLAELGQQVQRAIAHTKNPKEKLRAAAMAFFGFYAKNPRDLDLGFYLFRGGMKLHGLGKVLDEALNSSLMTALQPVSDAAVALGATRESASLLTADTFAHAAGLLLLTNTGRIRLFGASAPLLMERFVDAAIAGLATTGQGGRK